MLALLSGQQQPMSAPAARVSEPKKWVLTWSDEFNSPNGSPPDPIKWTVENGGHGWGNHELEYYTSRPENLRQENGTLVIEAINQSFTGPDGIARNYTSARLKTAKKFSQKYGRFEAGIKIPSGKGIWPAFWLLGDNISATHWPACGEIDIMESIGAQSTVYGTLHGPGYSGDHGLSTKYTLPTGVFTDDFHIYAVEWGPREIRFYADGHLYSTRTPADLPPGKSWVYDHPFFIILDLAVGGDWPGNPDASTHFPQKMLVDYVRVYREE
jgi:beta-glucanase (GH16 family)